MSAQPAFAREIEDDSLPEETDPVILNFAPILRRLRDKDLLRFCEANECKRLELSKDGELVVMPLGGGNTSRRSAKLNGLFGNWAEADGTGEGFGAFTGFRLPNGALRGPYLAWMKKDRWAALSEAEQEGFAPLCPDFVVELRSYSDPLKPLQAKLEEYLENGAQLGWLIDPYKRKVYVYRPGLLMQKLDEPETISGDPVLPGFVLPVAQLYQ
ncbi:MAG: Uma2 family endonuclease [Acidobacteria bacterium]|nr:Uma2 family endonuclease [Acidobacteriota bacterium]